MVPLQTDISSFIIIIITHLHRHASLVLQWHPLFYLGFMLAVSVIIKLASRIPTDREEEKDEGMKLGAIWERRVIASLLSELVSGRCSMRVERRARRRKGLIGCLGGVSAHSSAGRVGACHHQSGQL